MRAVGAIGRLRGRRRRVRCKIIIRLSLIHFSLSLSRIKHRNSIWVLGFLQLLLCCFLLQNCREREAWSESESGNSSQWRDWKKGHPTRTRMGLVLYTSHPDIPHPSGISNFFIYNLKFVKVAFFTEHYFGLWVLKYLFFFFKKNSLLIFYI